MVERDLAKVEVAGSSPVIRSIMAPWPSGKAQVCNTSIPSSILGGASNTKHPKGDAFFRVGGATRTIELCSAAKDGRIQLAFVAASVGDGAFDVPLI